MLRFAIFIVYFLCALTPLTSFADSTVHVRGSENDGYSRLVFDWGKTVPYMMTQTTPGKLSLRFTEPGSLDNPGLKLGNVEGMSVVSTSPLEVSIAVPTGSKPRDFQTGNRIIIDVYDPPGKKHTAPPKVAQAAPPVKVEPKTEAKPAPEPEKAKEPPKPKEEKTLAQAPPAAKAEVKPVVGADLAPPATPAPALEALSIVQPVPAAEVPKPEVVRPSNLITISSIDALGLSVFDRGGHIWIVGDKDNLMLSPQISGPDANYFMPIETLDIDGGKIYRIQSMEGARIRGQGGGLLWRVVVPAGPPKIKPTTPERVFAKPDDTHGKMIWPFEDARRIFKIADPETGKTLFVVTVGSAKKYAGPAMKFVDFETLDSPVGLILMQKVDDLDVTINSDGNVEVTRPGGLALTSDDKIASVSMSAGHGISPGTQANAKRIFDFRNWQMGGPDSMDQNRNVIMGNIGGLKGSDRVEGILTLAKMYLSNGMWAEAKGYLDLGQDEMPELNQNAAFIALHGAAQALGFESEEAFKELSQDELKTYPEIGYWQAFTLADLGDWQQADQVFPDELYILSEYPPIIRTKLSLVLAEVALRAGDTAKGEQLLGFADEYKDQLTPQQKAAMDYLLGEAARQRNKLDDTKKYWKELSVGGDDLYRAKAGLALTRLLIEKKELPPEKAIDNLERLRYAWRGDELEAQISYWLGKTYFEHLDYVKGLVIMREAATYAEDTDVGKRIVGEMTEVFKKLFLGPGLDKVSALDAAALHDQFTDYLEPGAETDKINERLAERLVKADLLDKATELLQGELGHLDSAEAYRITVRLAAINLLDNKPAGAMKALDNATEIYAKLPEELKTPERSLELSLLRARALSEQDRFEQAIALLNGLEHGPDVNKLRADIAWHAGYWDDASQALGDVILDRNISLTRPLDTDNTALILQRAVALNLAGDRVGVANLREKFSDAMAQTDKARIFEVVTRPRQSAALADRATLMGIVSEVDLFKDFLQGYKDEPLPVDQTAAAGATAAQPATPAATPPATATPLAATPAPVPAATPAAPATPPPAGK